VLFVLFSLSDEHFHGHPVSAEYVFKFDPTNPRMTGYEHYAGKVKVHFDEQAIEDSFGRAFGIQECREVAHPLYPGRRLWNVIARRLDDPNADLSGR